MLPEVVELVQKEMKLGKQVIDYGDGPTGGEALRYAMSKLINKYAPSTAEGCICEFTNYFQVFPPNGAGKVE